MKILLLGWNRLGKKKKGNWNHELFRRELAKQEDVIFFGIGYKGYDDSLTVQDILGIYPDIDIILTHYEYRESTLALGIEDVNIPKVHICGGDYNDEAYNDHLRKVNYDIVFPRYKAQLEHIRNNGIKSKYYILPWSVDTNKYYKIPSEKTVDVMASFQLSRGSSRKRKQLRNIISNMNVNSFIDKVYFEEYVRKINESKMFITYNTEERELAGKYTEVMACGTLLLANKPDELEELGYKPGYHLIIYKDDFSDLKDKINYFLKHEKEREEIAKNGMEFVRNRHSSKIRVKEFTEIVKWELIKKQEFGT